MMKTAFISLIFILSASASAFAEEDSQTSQTSIHTSPIIQEHRTNQETDLNTNIDSHANTAADNEDTSIPASPPMPDSVIITDIAIEGLHRTKKHYVLSEIGHYIGMKAASVDCHELETDLQRIGLFSDIQVSIRRTGAKDAVVDIVLKEKWSIIPIPMLMYADEFMGGLFLMDMNAFGVKDRFIVGGFGSKSKVRGMLAFSTPTVIGKPGISLSASGARDTSYIVDLDSHTQFKYDSINYTIGSRVSFKVSRNSTASAGISYRYSSNKPKDDFESIIESRRDFSPQALSINAGYKYETSDWNGWFLSAIRASVTAHLHLINTDTVSPEINLLLSYQRPIFVDRLRVFAHAGGVYIYNSPIVFHKKAVTAGIDILPNKYVTSAIVGGGAGAEVGLFRFFWASFSIGAQYQIAYARDWDGSFDFRHGWSAAVNVNLSKIAFPAFSIGVAQDDVSGNFKFAFGVGMSM